MPVDNEYQIEPEDGKDIVITLDTRIQEITENALLKMMEQNEAEHGCVIVMEVKTGKIKAIANLGRKEDGTYWEDFNYALTPSEPGSTFKLATLLTVLEDKKYSLNSAVNLQGGVWKINGRTVYDSERHNMNEVTVKRAFELSSNVGMAKLVYNSYSSNPAKYVEHLKQLGFGSTTGLDLYGERSTVIYKPGGKYWSATTLPWMAFGYNVAITPLHTAMLYNAVANDGRMMKPYLLNGVKKNGLLIREVEPVVLKDSICTRQTLVQLKECLEGVCKDSGATAFRLFKGTPYAVAGKTGTALVANGSRGYGDHIYQSSFAGYFPADDPQYTCVVVIKNKPHAVRFYGAAVAGPVFKEISDKLYTMKVQSHDGYALTNRNDSGYYNYTGKRTEIKNMLNMLAVPFADSTDGNVTYARMNKTGNAPVLQEKNYSKKSMPELNGLGLKDALFVCENMGLSVKVSGVGKVVAQSIQAGSNVGNGQSVQIYLN